MVVFLQRRPFQLAAGPGVPGGEGLPLVEGLGGDLPGMVDAHEPRSPFPLAGGEAGFGEPLGRVRTPGDRRGAEDRADPPVEVGDEMVKGGVAAHTLLYQGSCPARRERGERKGFLSLRWKAHPRLGLTHTSPSAPSRSLSLRALAISGWRNI